MSVSRWRVATAVAAVAAVPLTAAVAAPAGAASGINLHRLVRYNLVLPGLSKATSLGAASKATRLTIGVGLLHPHPAAEQAAYTAMYDPHSPSYHHFLTSAEYDARFGVAKSESSALQKWLRSGGLSIQTVDSARDYLTATGTLGQVSKLMHTSFGKYRIGHDTFIANRVGPEVPAALPIDGVLGLNTLQRVWTEPELQAANHSSGAAHPAASSSYTGTLVARDLWGAYDMPGSDEGQGQTAGVFGDGSFDSVTTDLRYFEKREHLPRVPVRRVAAEGGNPESYPDNLESVEWMLDSQSITGMAPKLSRLDLYFAKTPLDVDVAAAFAKWASDKNGPKQMNASFGECESDPTSPVVKGTPYSTALYGLGVGNQLQIDADPSLRKAAMEGRTLFSSAGDTGGSCPVVILPVIGAGNGVDYEPYPTASYPAASQYDTAVGGTVLSTNGTTASGAHHVKHVHRTKEVSWSFSGGGTAARTPEPAFQKNVKAIDLPCAGGTNATNQPIPPGTICRGVPDLAAMSGEGLTDSGQGVNGSNGYLMSADGLPFPEGGTSLSSPLTVGMWSRIQAAAKPKAGLGFASPIIYRDAESKNYSSDFTDMTDSDLHDGNGTYQNAKGWDYVSGWGVLNVKHFIQHVDHNPKARPTHPHAQAKETPKRTCAATMSSPKGNAYDISASEFWPPANDAAQDITKAGLRLSHHGKDLVVTESGPTLAPSPPANSSGSYYYVLWMQGSKTRFAGASVSPGGSVQYVVGHTDVKDELQYVVDKKLTTGASFAHHRLKVVVPLKDIGSPKHGALLRYPYAVTVNQGSVFVGFATDTAAPVQPSKELVVSKKC